MVGKGDVWYGEDLHLGGRPCVSGKVGTWPCNLNFFQLPDCRDVCLAWHPAIEQAHIVKPLFFLSAFFNPPGGIFSHGVIERAQYFTSELSSSLKAFTM